MYRHFAVISAHIKGDSFRLNLTRYIDLQRELELHKLAFAPCLGFYDGELEDSVLVELHGAQCKEAIMALARKFEQQTVLFVDNELCRLVEVGSGKSAFIGHWTPVSKDSALAGLVWTKVGDTYYVAL